MKQYIIQIASSGRDCFYAGCDGDPGRTLIKESAKVYDSKNKADKSKLKLEKDWSNRIFEVVEL